MTDAPAPRILIFAYACAPGAGSEPGAGWGIVREFMSVGECVVLVSPKHLPAIERWEAVHGRTSACFVGVEDPGERKLWEWHRVAEFLAYIRWLGSARREGLRLHAQKPFDLIVHATYSVYWLPSPCVDFGVPCLWGPVGGAVATPRGLRSLLGWKGLLDDYLDRVAVRSAARWPATRRTWARVDRALAQNLETQRELPDSLVSRSRIMNHVHFIDLPSIAEMEPSDFILWASPLESRKGPRLAVHVLARTPDDMKLVMVGDGPEWAPVRRLASRLGVDGRLEMRGRVPREELLRLFSGAAVALFTGLREEGGLALAEAMSMGTPTVVLGHGGPRDIAARATDPSRVTIVSPGPVEEVAEAMADALVEHVGRRVSPRGSTLDVAGARADLKSVVSELL